MISPESLFSYTSGLPAHIILSKARVSALYSETTSPHKYARAYAPSLSIIGGQPPNPLYSLPQAT